MPKLKREVVQKREEFVTKLFETNPALSIPKANKLVIAKFNSMMRPQRLYELRNMVNAKSAASPDVAGAVVAAD